MQVKIFTHSNQFESAKGINEWLQETGAVIKFLEYIPSAESYIFFIVYLIPKAQES